jgi:hypothetical protein
MVPGRGLFVVEEPDLAELLNALKRTRAVDQTLHRLQVRHELSLRGFLLANGPAPKPQMPIPEQDTTESLA